MSSYSSYKEQQLLTEAWRSYVLAEQQPVSSQKPATQNQTPQQKIISLSKQKISQAGPSEETKKAFSDAAFLNKLSALAKTNPLQAVDLILNYSKGDDSIEISKFNIDITLKTKLN